MKQIYLFLFLGFFTIANSQTIGLTQHEAGSTGDGYVLFAPLGSTTTYLIDKCGKQVKTWQSNYLPGASVYLLPDGSLIRCGKTNSTIFTAGGNGRPGGNYSTVEILNTPVNGFNYTATLPYLPSTPSWIYNQGNPNNYYAAFVSGAQPLPNGNLLICNGVQGFFNEITPAGTSVWRYVNPVSNTGIMTQGTVPSFSFVFRGTFYPNNYSAFVGQTLVSGAIIEDTNSVSEACYLNLNISSETLAESVTLFPIPAKEVVTLQMNSLQQTPKSLVLYNTLGQLVQTLTVPSTSQDFTFSVAGLPRGMYLLQLHFEQGIVTKKILLD